MYAVTNTAPKAGGRVNTVEQREADRPEATAEAGYRQPPAAAGRTPGPFILPPTRDPGPREVAALLNAARGRR